MFSFSLLYFGKNCCYNITSECILATLHNRDWKINNHSLLRQRAKIFLYCSALVLNQNQIVYLTTFKNTVAIDNIRRNTEYFLLIFEAIFQINIVTISQNCYVTADKTAVAKASCVFLPQKILIIVS